MTISWLPSLMGSARAIPVAAAVVSCMAVPASADVFYWDQSQSAPSKVIASMGTDHCVLIGIGGKFMGTGEQAGIWHDAKFWYLGGKSQQQGVHAYAYCFARSKFTSSALDAVRWSSDDIRLTKGGGGCHSAVKLAWWGDAMTAISRVAGGLRGFGERAEVQQATQASLPSQLVTTTCQGTLDVTAYSLFVGKPGGVKPMVGASATGTPTPTGYEFSLDHDGDVAMSSADASVCYLTAISGTFNGNAEEIRIIAVSSDGRWHLRVKHASGQGIRARARCIMFDQD